MTGDEPTWLETRFGKTLMVEQMYTSEAALVYESIRTNDKLMYVGQDEN